jgi:polysaccharide export outer membrane protein
MKALKLTSAGCLLVASLFATTLYGQQTQPEIQRKEDAKPELAPGAKPTRTELDAARNAANQQVTGGTLTAAPVDPRAYQIGPEDILAIQVWKEPEFSRTVQVRPDGKFTLPLLGDITAAGLTPNGLGENLTKELTKYINKPEVTVFVQSVQSKKFYITGEINRTGSFPLVVPTTILEALTNAGGFREYAKRNKIYILRGNQRIKFNYNEVIKGKKLEQNILVENGDYIFVP